MRDVIFVDVELPLKQIERERLGVVCHAVIHHASDSVNILGVYLLEGRHIKEPSEECDEKSAKDYISVLSFGT